MKVRLLILFIALGTMADLIGQDLMVFGGMNNNRFCDYRKDNSHFSTFYSSLSGSNFGIGLDNVKVAKQSFLFTLRTSSYNGYVYTTDRKPSEVITTGIEVNKSILGLGIYPLNFKMMDNQLNFSFGLETNVLLQTSLKGYRTTSFDADKASSTSIIDNSSKGMVNSFGMGLAARIAYRLKIAKNLHIMPQYTFYGGLTNELKNIEANTKAYRHTIEIGLVRSIFSK